MPKGRETGGSAPGDRAFGAVACVLSRSNAHQEEPQRPLYHRLVRNSPVNQRSPFAGMTGDEPYVLLCGGPPFDCVRRTDRVSAVVCNPQFHSNDGGDCLLVLGQLFHSNCPWAWRGPRMRMTVGHASRYRGGSTDHSPPSPDRGPGQALTFPLRGKRAWSDRLRLAPIFIAMTGGGR